ncbi:MAG TPA: methyltransferase domain-containing protein [Dermatophilaceae bacterium]
MAGTSDNARAGAFCNVDVEVAASRLAQLLVEEGADVLTVYDPHANYGHPDHVQVHVVGVRAAELAGVTDRSVTGHRSSYAPTQRPEVLHSGVVALSAQHTAQARSFGARAVEYQRGRPSYPDEAVDWLLRAGAQRVLDLGAGTGQLTRRLVARGLDVVAVEPSDGMREQLIQAVPGVRVLPGSAESIPLQDGAVEIVLVAQAWHWVDVERAVPEVSRVLSDAGQLGLIWNIRDEREDWVAQFGQLMCQGAEQDMGSASPRVGQPFGPVERLDVEWIHHFTPPDLLDLVASRSYVITLPADERQALLASVQHLLDSHPSLAGRRRLEMPYIAQCSLAALIAG